MRPHRAGGEDRPMSTQEFRERSIELLEGMGEVLDSMAEDISAMRSDIARVQMLGLEVKK